MDQWLDVAVYRNMIYKQQLYYQLEEETNKSIFILFLYVIDLEREQDKIDILIHIHHKSVEKESG